MRRVTFAGPGTGPGITTSAVAYGCASLMARVPLGPSVRLLQTAFDVGVTHFDTARLYGYGEAERALADFLVGRRDAVTVTTKFGIIPPRRSGALRTAVTVARRIVSVAPGLRPLIRRQAARLTTGSQFTVPQARASLETSLRELRTEYVDFLMLHDCGADDAADDLFEFLDRCVQEGKVRQIGVASSRAVATTMRQRRPALVAQYPWHPGDNASMPAPAQPPAFVHSVLGARLRDVTERLSADPRLTKRWSDALQLDCADPQVVGGLLLHYAQRDANDGVVIFSSVTDTHIRANVRNLGAQRFSTGQIDRFARLIAEMAAARPLRAER